MTARKLTVGSLCTGFGGLEMGLEAVTRLRPLWFAETDTHAIDILRHRWPRVANLGDIRDALWTTTDVPDVITAGFPCQPVSAAGAQLGHADPRWLWPAVRRAVEIQRPQIVFLENVRNITSIAGGAVMAGILADLRGLGYACRWLILGACAVGAAHHRHRWFLRGDFVAGTGYRVPEAVQVAVPSCGARRVRDGDKRGMPSAGLAQDRLDSGRRNLDDALALLPTPTASESTGAGPAPNTQSGMNLRTAVTLMPSPRASDGVNGGPGQRGSVQPGNWGRYGPAVERASRFYGPPPAATEVNGNGNARLSPGFVEWLMGVPAGTVAGRVPRIAALRLLGNGAMPAQVAAAWSLLSNRPE